MPVCRFCVRHARHSGVDGDCMMNSLMDHVKIGTVKLGGGVAARSSPSSSNRALALFGLFPAIGVVAAIRGRNGPRRRRNTE